MVLPSRARFIANHDRVTERQRLAAQQTHITAALALDWARAECTQLAAWLPLSTAPKIRSAIADALGLDPYELEFASADADAAAAAMAAAAGTAPSQ